MTSTEDNRFFFSAWGLSLALHGVVVGLALAFVVQVNPVLQKELFQWDVALVEEARLDSNSESVKSAMAPEQPPVKKALSSHRTITPIEQKILPPQPTVETVQPIEQKVKAPQPREEPIEQRMVEMETKSVQAAEAKESVAVAALPEPAESQPVQQEPAVIASASPLMSQAVPAQASSQDSTVNEAPAPGHEARSDNRWLAESLWRRVAELKRYPNSARLNGQEGKVILKAVIRSDGYLADVSVQKSSGHSILDAAAIEAVKLACPLHMEHAIGKPQIVVSLPIVYSLAN